MEQVSISDVLEFVRNGKSIKQLDNGSGIPITRIETIWNSSIDSTRFGYADINDVSQHENHLLEPGDILMSHINSPKHLGKCALYEGYPEELIHGMNLLGLRPIKEISDPKYLYFYLSSGYFRQQIVKISNQSVNQASFSSGNLKKLKIPLPPLADQQKIAEILDAADALRQKDQQLIDHYTALSQSLFLDMFGDPVTNPMGWEVMNTGSVLEVKSQNGLYLTKDKYQSNGVEMIHMSDAFYGIVSPGKLKTVVLTSKELEKYQLTHRDLLLARRSLTYEGAAKPCLIPNYDKPLVYESSLIRITPKKDLMDTTYMYYFFSNERARNAHVYKYISRSTISGINNKGLNAIDIFVPPIELQNQFAERIAIIEKQKQQAKPA